MNIKDKAMELSETEAFYGMEDSFPGFDILTDCTNKSIEKRIYKRFANIYKYLHSVNKKHECYDSHKDWRLAIENIEEEK